MRIALVVSLLVCVVLLGGVMPSAHAQEYHLDHYYIAPPEPEPEPETVAKALHAKRYPLSEGTVRAWLGQPMPVYAVEGEDFNSDGMKKMMMDAPPHQVAMNRRVDVEAALLFDASIPDGNNRVYLASLNSSGAFALRLRVNLMGLRSGDTLWLLDANGDAAFGPYTNTTAKTDGQWLPPTLGDSVTLALSSTDDVLPLLTIMDVAHFYKPIVEKQLPSPLYCNIPIAQETNTVAQEVSAAVGRILIPFSNGQGLCTTTLLNSNKLRAGAPAPYLIGAWHCFGEGVDYDSVTVYWDYRSPNADGSDLPSLYDLDWNFGAKLVDHSFSLDSSLLELNNQVSVGPYGRAWAGWDSVAPDQDASVQVIHHPVGGDLKTSRGRISSDSTDTCMNMTCSDRYDNQIEVLWNEGVTEQGSSGSALLMRSNNYRIAGMLSNGNTHSCSDPSNNFDNFGPFHAFFPQIGCHLVTDYQCQDAYEPESSGCFLFRKGVTPEMLQNLRVFRDETLNKTALGKRLVTDYYAQAPALENLIDNNPVARGLFYTLLTLGSAWGAGM